MKKTVLITMVSILLISSALFAVPGKGPHGGPMNCGPGGDQEQCMAMMQEKLGLSEDQIAKITELKSGMKMDCGKTKKEIAILKNKLDGVMLQDDPDVNKAEKLITEIGKLKTERKVTKMKMKMKIRSILTEEQQMKMGHGGMMMGCDKMGHGGKMGCDKKGHGGMKDCDKKGKGPHGAKKRCH
jgi:Spy/CpxP family protein refolding chaperone